MSLYNAKIEGDSLRVTKFDQDLNPIDDSSYLTTAHECTCPAGSRATCRHREMYPILRSIANLPQFWDYEAGKVVNMLDDSELEETNED